MVAKAKKMRDQARWPYLGQFNRRAEFEKIFLANRKHPRALILDLDGTLIRLTRGDPRHRKPEFRPLYEGFLTIVSRFADLFVFSATTPTRLQHIAKTYLGDRFAGFFDHRFLSRRKKNVDWLARLTPDIILVDDTPAVVHKWSQQYLVPIPTWSGDKKDRAFCDTLREIRRRWGLAE